MSKTIAQLRSEYTADQIDALWRLVFGHVLDWSGDGSPKNKGVSGTFLAGQLGISEEKLRGLRRLAWASRYRIGSHPGYGYFRIVSLEDIRLTRDQIRSRREVLDEDDKFLMAIENDVRFNTTAVQGGFFS